MPDLKRTIDRMKRLEETVGDSTTQGAGQVLRDAIALLEEYRKVPKWIPITEGLPSQFEVVWATDGEDVGLAALQGFCGDELLWTGVWNLDYLDDPDDEDYLPIIKWKPLETLPGPEGGE